MDKNKWLFFLAIFFCCKFCCAQKNDFDFVVAKIQQNYPGFKEKTTTHDFNKFVKQTISKKERDTFKMLSEIVAFFNDQHLQIIEPASIRSFDSAASKTDLSELRKYLDGSNKKSNYEGYWINDYNDCVIGIKQTGKTPLTYKAYVVEQKNDVLPLGFTLAVFEGKANDTYFTDYTRPQTGGRIFLNAHFRNDSVLTTGAYGKWKKLKHYHTPMLSSRPDFNYLSSAQLLDSNTYLLTIPGSTENDVTIVDSIFKNDAAKIKQCKTLLIDLRNNLGGTVRTFTPILPYLYTNPIVRPAAGVFCSEDIINKRMADVADYIKQGKVDSTELKAWLAEIDNQRKHMGSFVYVDPDTVKYDAVMAMPKNIGIIMNYACQSASEMLILDAMQSKKVTLFGEHTMGAVDFLDFYPIAVPSGKYRIFMPITKRAISKKDVQLDGKGIKPHIEIKDTVADWVDYVRDYYEKH